MSIGSSNTIKEQLKQSIDIVDLVGATLSLRRQGRMFVGVCPWHDDTRPSLQVNPDRQTFKCWVCDIGGDIFTFVMKREGISFPEALRMLADRAGIVLSPVDAAQREQQAAAAEDKNTLYKAMAWAAELFHECLLNPSEGNTAREYLKDREITPESIDRFQIGFAPNRWDWLIERAGNSPFSTDILQKIGVLGKSQSGHLYDRFKGRVLFPILDLQHRPIALGGRILPDFADDRSAKYINSPETPLFSKNRELYGLEIARNAIVKTNNVLVMEGYTDCIIAHQEGFANSVAVLGTALGENHLRRLRFSDSPRITLVLDGDDAGRRRANQILELFISAQVDLRILTLPNNMDPCDYLLQYGRQAFTELVESAVDALEHKVQTTTDKVDPNDMHQSQAAIEDVLATLAKAHRVTGGFTSAAQLREQQILSRLARQFQLPESQLRGRLQALRRSVGRAPAPTDTHLANPDPDAIEIIDIKLDNYDRQLLELLIAEPDQIEWVAQRLSIEQIQSPVAQTIYGCCCRLLEAGQTPNLETLLLANEQPQIQNVLVEIDDGAHRKDYQNILERLTELVNSYQCREDSRQHRTTSGLLRERAVDEHDGMKILQKRIEQEKARQGISPPMEG